MRGLLDAVAPVRCVACGRTSDGELCGGCAHDVRVIAPPMCRRCGSPGRDDPLCPACRDLEGFARARSLVAYSEPARALTLALKRRGRPPLARASGALLADLALASGMRPDAVAHVPGGRRARREGFDHTALLAGATADALGVPLVRALRRGRDGPRQADVGLRDRRTNVAGRFVSRPVGGNVLLVDDVYTTGATAEACARALRDAGAAAVEVVTFARTLLRRAAGGVRIGPAILGA